MNGYSRNVLDQNITNSILKRSREEVISQFKNRATTTRNELWLRFNEPQSMIGKGKYSILPSKDVIKNIRRVIKDKIFAQWINVEFIEEKSTMIISKILDEWDKKQSSQRRDLNELFKFLKSQGMSANYKRNIEANRSSKFVTHEDLKFLYSHPSISMQDGMKYWLTRNEFYFYKNFEMLIVLTSSYQINESIKNYEISSMRNLASSLYFKLLNYSKLFNSILEWIKDNSISNTYWRFKHSIILEQFNSESESGKSIEGYNVLNYDRTKRILFSLTKTLEKVNWMISVDLQIELDYYQQVYWCILTKEKASSIIEHIHEMKQKIYARYDKLCWEYDEDLIVDLINELTDISNQLQVEINESHNTVYEKVVELYKKKLMLWYQLFAKSDSKNENPGSTTHSKDEEKELGIDDHIEKLQSIFEILDSSLPSLLKLESKAAESGLILVSMLSFDFHIFLVRIIERCVLYQKSLSKLLYVILSVFIHLTYNGFWGEKDQEDEDGEGDSEQNPDMDVHDGTGIGEGKGMQNISDQIEHEEQLEGLKDEQGDPDEQPKDKEKDKKKEDEKFFDMKNDFDGDNEEEEEKEKDEDEIDSQQLDDEMDDVDNKLDNEMFNQDNEISEDEQEEEEQKEEKKQPVDLDKQVDIDNKQKEAKGDDQKNKEQNEKPNEQNETEMEQKEDQNDINEQQNDEEKPYVNVDEQIKEDPESQQEPEGDEEEMQPEEDEDNDEEMSVEGQHKFDPTKDEQNKNEGESDENDNDFDIDDLNDIEEDDNEGNDQNIDEELKSEINSDDDNPDQDPDVDADREQKPDEDDKIFASKVNIDKKQDNNTLGNTQEKGEKKEQQDNENQQNNDEQKDYNTEDNDYLFQVMKQFMENKNKEQQKKPKEGERNEDQNMKKAENIEEIEDLPEQADNQENQDLEGQDFAKDDKSKELRSNVADTVKYNDQDMEPQEEKQEESLAPNDKDEEMSIDQEDKDLDEVKDNDPIKSLIKTNEFYQKYLEDKSKKNEDKKESNEKDLLQKDDKPNKSNEDAEMEDESEEEKEKFEIKLDKHKLDNSVLDPLQLRKSMIDRYEKWRKDKELTDSSFELLNKFKKTTNHLSIALCEQMRMILEPTEKSKLKGDYKTGRRINIKKIIPFIASNYRNDKIWLRREMPFKRDYRVLIAIDDSLSMKRNNLGFFALESLVAITEALNQLNVGKVWVCGINDRMSMHMSFEDTYSAEKAAFILSNYSFEYQSFASADTSIPNFMADCNKLLDSLKTENRNIVFIISDGRFNKKKVMPYIMEAEDRKYLYVFILLDNYDVKHKNSIYNMKSAEWIVDEEGKSEIKLRRYLDDFPFKYYTVVQEITHLPKVLSNIFLQWLAMVNS